ncbi:hypothetical protein HTY54_05330 [Escherichia coli]|nr:hypothetical protein [Escherichia coli]
MRLKPQTALRVLLHDSPGGIVKCRQEPMSAQGGNFRDRDKCRRNQITT